MIPFKKFTCDNNNQCYNNYYNGSLPSSCKFSQTESVNNILITYKHDGHSQRTPFNDCDGDRLLPFLHPHFSCVSFRVVVYKMHQSICGKRKRRAIEKCCQKAQVCYQLGLELISLLLHLNFIAPLERCHSTVRGINVSTPARNEIRRRTQIDCRGCQKFALMSPSSQPNGSQSLATLRC